MQPTATRIAINGFGRIGRLLYRLIHESDAVQSGAMEIALVNDTGKGGVVAGAHLLEFDSTQGRWKDHTVAVDGDEFCVDGHATVWSCASAIEDIPLRTHRIDIVPRVYGCMENRGGDASLY